jgi:hypothetical protein
MASVVSGHRHAGVVQTGQSKAGTHAEGIR